MQKDKARLIIMAIVSILLLATITFYAVKASISEKNLGGLIPVLIPLLVIIFMAFFIWRRFKDVRQGMPLEDERSRKVVIQASASAFQVSLYWLLAISWFEPFFAKTLFNAQKLDAGQTVGGGIAGMAILFLVFWLYYNKKGKLI